MPDFLLPDLGEGLTDAELVSWSVQVGDQVAVDQSVAEVETAKAVVEVPVPFAGTVSALHAEPGGVVKVGAPLLTVTPVAERSGNVLVGFGPSEPPRRPRRAAGSTPAPAATAPRPRSAPPSLPAAPSSSTAPSSTAPSSTAPSWPAQPARTGPVPVISPLVRKLARDHGVDLTRVAGTGLGGMIRRHDVAQAMAAAGTPAAADDPVTTSIPATADPGEKRLPLRGARKVMADKLARSRREIPEATVWVDVDATGLLEARAMLNRHTPQQPVSLTALVARFAVLALRQYPELNAHLDGDEIVIPGHVHLGFAAQTDRGLVVPVVRDAHLMSARDLSAVMTERTATARSGRLTPADLTGGTITVNNYGVFGVDGSAAIINYPEVAILGLGRIIDRPWAVDGQLAVRKVTELTLAFDHRVCDGGVAGGFLRYVADCMESPVLALGEL
jgi:pyruvate dehydrogenase E2 component (dihydrolipoamide acetyltransferase)